jgi:uncharacterized protein with NRDE domain
LPLAAWANQPQVVGGRDESKGGSWLALRGRRLAAVTNVRGGPPREGLSRGGLVADFVGGDTADSVTALDALTPRAAAYSPFNLLLHDGQTLAFATNRPIPHAPDGAAAEFDRRILAPGIHGISNGPLDAPWPKTERLMARLRAWIEASSVDSSSTTASSAAASTHRPDLTPLFEALADPTPMPDRHLPDTGVGLERERFLSPAFIAHANYGTRASTVVLIADDHAHIVERRFGPEAMFLGETAISLAPTGG